MKIFKKILLLLLVAFVILQFFRPAKNISTADSARHISSLYAVPAGVEQTLIKACYDCHSNNTRYPWYNNIQPVTWWLNSHVNDGKRHLNFDQFTTYRVAKQYQKLEECIDEVKDGAMPLSSYTIIHKDAILNDAEKTAFFTWCENVRESIKAKYPADSLVIPKRTR